jgi:hypothetical protein
VWRGSTWRLRTVLATDTLGGPTDGVPGIFCSTGGERPDEQEVRRSLPAAFVRVGVHLVLLRRFSDRFDQEVAALEGNVRRPRPCAASSG